MEPTEFSLLVERALHLKSIMETLSSASKLYKTKDLLKKDFAKETELDCIKSIVRSRENYFGVNSICQEVITSGFLVGKKPGEIVKTVADIIFAFVDTGEVAIEGKPETGFKFRNIKNEHD